MSGIKQFRHPEVGDFDLHFEVLHLPDANGQRIMTHTAELGSSAAAALNLLRTSGAGSDSVQEHAALR